MKMKILASLWLMAIWIAAPAAPPGDMGSLLPELQGWSKDGGVATFMPDNLYEYIDGAAENFLAYGFRRLAVQNYANAQKQALSAEIYFHGDADNAFGIYGSERPLAGDYLPIGSQGYYEEGVLNFISDAYYVKLNGFDLGAGGRQVLTELAERIAAAIHGANVLPQALNAFPAPGRVAHSERFIADHFLGHDFLGSAYTADYDLQGQKFKLFIMKTEGAEGSQALLRRWFALEKGRVATEAPTGSLVINDPYNGPVSVSWHEGHIWGGVGQSEGMEALIRELGTNLTTKKER